MYAIMGITGQVGAALADALIKSGKSVRGIVRNRAKAANWSARGLELALAESDDAPSLSAAFDGMEGIFVMIPPNFTPSENYPETRAVVAALASAAMTAKVPKVLALSSVGAHRLSGLGLITQLRLLEDAFAALPIPVTFLRPAWFMENAVWDLAPASKTGIVSSFLTPLDRSIPMIATVDVGQVAARLLLEDWSEKRVVELESSRPYSPNDLASAIGTELGQTVTAERVPRSDWEKCFKSQGTNYPAPRIEMLDGFNSGWITFQGAPACHIAANTELSTVIKELVAKTKG